jgi:nitroreductase
MDTLKAIYSRKSVRSYTGEPPTNSQLAEILKAANASPVGRGLYENLHLTVVSDADLLAAIDANAASDACAHPLYGAPLLIIVSSSAEGNVPSANVGIVVHSMALAAVELGIGHCDIFGAIRELKNNAALVAQLQLPAGFSPLGALVLGVSTEDYEPREIPARIEQNEI